MSRCKSPPVLEITCTSDSLGHLFYEFQLGKGEFTTGRIHLAGLCEVIGEKNRLLIRFDPNELSVKQFGGPSG